MSIQATRSSVDIPDNPDRQLGQVGIIDNYQDAYLPLIFEQLQLITVLLAIIAEENINLETEVDMDDLIALNEEVLALDEDI